MNRLRAVSDASGLIALSDIGLLDLVAPMFDSCVIPPAVALEIAPTVQLPGWIAVQPLMEPLDRRVVDASLDPGETEALSLALELDRYTVFVDELGARRVASALGLPVIGVVGVVVRAKNVGIIASVRPNIEKLVTSGFFMSGRLIDYALKQAGETSD